MKLLIPQIALFAFVMGVYGPFLDFIETRPGAVLNDPLLKILPAVDLSWISFSIVYSSLAFGIWNAYKSNTLFLLMNSYSVLVIVRMIAMYLVPLDPPEGMILLRDPLVGLFTEKVLTRDLFFSGHIATIFLLYGFALGKIQRRIYLVGTAVLALCLLIQHVHYTLDILAALIVAYLIVTITPPKWRSRGGIIKQVKL